MPAKINAPNHTTTAMIPQTWMQVAAPQDTRREWAAAHAATIAALLEKPNHADVSQRLYRLRYWLEGEYVVAALLDNLKAAAGSFRVITYVSRGFQHARLDGATFARQQLMGDYSPDEIVAFLRLDLVDPATVEWADETRYSKVFVMGNIANLIGKTE